MKNIITGIGEALWDILPEGKKIGGAPANFAYHCSQFGYESYVASAVGNDLLGDEIINALQSSGLKQEIARVDYPTGTVKVVLDSKGIPTYDICENVAWDNIAFTQQLKALARHTTAVCFGSLAQRSPISRKAIHQFLQENCNKIIQDFKLKEIIVTCGAKGSYVASAEGTFNFEPTPKIKVADTVGAGDSFTAAYCSATLAGKNCIEAHKLAVEVSSYVCTCNGAMPKLPKHLIEKIR